MNIDDTPLEADLAEAALADLEATAPHLAARLRNDFTHHPPVSGTVGARHTHARAVLLQAAATLATLTGESREQSLMFTALEEAMFWANADIARYQRGADDG